MRTTKPSLIATTHISPRCSTLSTQMPLGQLSHQVRALAREWGFPEGSVEQVLLTERLLGTGGEVRHYLGGGEGSRLC